MEQIAKDRDRVWDSTKGEISGGPPKPAAQKTTIAARLAGARKRAMPDRIVPQLTTLVDEAPEGAEWLHEIKYDGYRLLARIKKGKSRLITRNGLDWTAKFPALARAMAGLRSEERRVGKEWKTRRR